MRVWRHYNKISSFLQYNSMTIFVFIILSSTSLCLLNSVVMFDKVETFDLSK